jgi:MoaA/NifB/PqqE/SkfB family radical SAM enzyme
MGGEPLLYRGFDAVVSQIKSLGMECDITTNGVLIPEYAKQLENVDMLMVSLDGNEKGNDANRGRGSWKLITKGIETAKAHEIPLRINCVLTRNNVTEIEDLLDYASTVNAYVGFTIPAKCPSLDSMADQALTRDEIILVHERLLDLAKKGYKITLSEQSIKHVMKYPRPFDELVYKTDPDHKSIYPNECPYGRFIVFIDAKGSIYPCTTLWEFPSVFQPKNIFSDGFDEALRHAQDLPCWICYCAGGPEWDYFTSLKGIIHGLRFSMRV